MSESKDEIGCPLALLGMVVVIACGFIRAGMGYEIVRHYFNVMPMLTWDRAWLVVVVARLVFGGYHVDPTKEVKRSSYIGQLIGHVAVTASLWLAWAVVT